MRSINLAPWATVPGGVGRAIQRSQTSMRRFKPRRLRPPLRLPPRISRALWFGLLSIGLYLLLFYNERAALEWSVKYSWSFLVPIAIAFVFSFAHGAFTGAFWDAVGLKPKSTKKPKG